MNIKDFKNTAGYLAVFFQIVYESQQNTYAGNGKSMGYRRSSDNYAAFVYGSV